MENFIKELKTKIVESRPELEIVEQEMLKNNGVILNGLTIKESGANILICPTFYVNNYYEAYVKNKVTIEEIANNLLESYDENKNIIAFDTNDFLDYENVKTHLTYKLVNYEKNKEILKDVPHFKFHDLACLYVFIVEEGVYSTAGIIIKNEHLKTWNITEKTLRKDAKECVFIANDFKITNINDLIQEMYIGKMPQIELNELLEALEHTSISMYVCSNRAGSFGANILVNNNALVAISELCGGDYYVIPSSIHEIICIPYEDAQESTDLSVIKNMVYEVNRTQVSEMEVLSDSVYYYDSINNILSIV